MNEVMGYAWAMLIFSAVTCAVVVLANIRRARKDDDK